MGKDKEEKKAKKEKKEEKAESEIKKEKKEKKEKKVKAEAEVPEDDKAAKKAAKKAKKAAEAAAAAAPPPEDEKAAKKAKKAAKRAAEEAAAAEEVPAKKAKKEKKEKKEEEAPAAVAPAGGDEQVRVYVANLPFSVDDASIQATFAECGTIVSTDWLTHSDTGRFKGATRTSQSAAPPRLATLGLLLSAPGSSRYALHALSSGARAPQIPVGGCGGTARSGPRHGRLPPAPVPRL